MKPRRGARLEQRDWLQLFPPSTPVDPKSPCAISTEPTASTWGVNVCLVWWPQQHKVVPVTQKLKCEQLRRRAGLGKAKQRLGGIPWQELEALFWRLKVFPSLIHVPSK